MGLYIKGMDLTEIEKLVLTKNIQMIFSWTSDMKLTAKTRIESDSGIVSYSKEFDVVEVPEPHGRLIDADKLLSDEQYEKYMRDILIEGETGNLYIRPQDVADLLFDAPTVIEAEGE